MRDLVKQAALRMTPSRSSANGGLVTRCLSLCLLATAAFAAACGDRPESADGPGSPAAGARAPLRDSVRVAITAKIGTRDLTASGWGECHHAAEASIYGKAAEMWQARYDAPAEGLSAVNLTVWRPKLARSAQASLHVEAHGKSYAVATVEGGQLSGRGSSTAYNRASGGLLAVDGHDDSGTVVKVMVECERVTDAVAEGG